MMTKCLTSKLKNVSKLLLIAKVLMNTIQKNINRI